MIKRSPDYQERPRRLVSVLRLSPAMPPDLVSHQCEPFHKRFCRIEAQAQRRQVGRIAEYALQRQASAARQYMPMTTSGLCSSASSAANAASRTVGRVVLFNVVSGKVRLGILRFAAAPMERCSPSARAARSHTRRRILQGWPSRCQCRARASPTPQSASWELSPLPRNVRRTVSQSG